MPGARGGESEPRLSIAAAVIRAPQSDMVLLARRPAHVAHGGLWEFPGGKQEPGEPLRDALARELREELGIEVLAARPYLRIPHDYPHVRVELNVWVVEQWRGNPRGMEGQALEWVPIHDLPQREFPAANLGIVTALQLPPIMAVTPDLPRYDAPFLDRVDALLAGGTRLLQFRSHQAPPAGRKAALAALAQRCRAAGAALVVNGSVAEARDCGAQGVHLPARMLAQCEARPLPRPLLVGASCHDARELGRAEALGVDYALLGPVQPTASHPGAAVLGWEGLAGLIGGGRHIPVFAIGGLRGGDLSLATGAGAHGIAMIGALWGGVW